MRKLTVNVYESVHTSSRAMHGQAKGVSISWVAFCTESASNDAKSTLNTGEPPKFACFGIKCARYVGGSLNPRSHTVEFYRVCEILINVPKLKVSMLSLLGKFFSKSQDWQKQRFSKTIQSISFKYKLEPSGGISKTIVKFGCIQPKHCYFRFRTKLAAE